MRTKLDMRGSRDMGKVLDYFEVTATRFASIYGSPRLVDRIFRRDMYERFRRTLQECDPLEGRSVLDIGCGSGQYATALAERGAGEVIGLDFATNMFRIATENARRAGVADKCRFVVGNSLTYPFDRRFDYVLAIGFFDYVSDPLPYLRRAREVTAGKFVATFPRRLTWRALVRKVRLGLAGCPVFFYTRRRVEELMRQAGFTVEKREVCGKIYFVTGKPA
ncbi:MAG: methyltransferase domain-containing protein [Candidatus Rokubacteria bacterium]|nr:methyltransferase domain-containing protein [Candidatus Rokubacteria bacterium]